MMNMCELKLFGEVGVKGQGERARESQQSVRLSRSTNLVSMPIPTQNTILLTPAMMALNSFLQMKQMKHLAVLGKKLMMRKLTPRLKGMPLVLRLTTNLERTPVTITKQATLLRAPMNILRTTHQTRLPMRTSVRLVNLDMMPLNTRQVNPESPLTAM
ncbi:hypothetical protein A1O3_04238 [Capronia epimyces CBS 606.96]|uniref:Uncharacterized protein n=1 Tax=Capronia epimyces CBS 606.96 TaxID=1182542 RepID=W9YYA1_9EURO|nr:uncharacterized protein A1O3_04238 [Capronia epimyces CBS 606.96]EXJ87279.1 hypothetical protein A1O3_04238 [Capronia epimyces CBS 606.96]